VLLRVEFTIEPFAQGDLGPHVRAAVDATERSGLAVELGPAVTAVSGDEEAVLTAVDGIVRAATADGATRVSLQVVRGG
jgi:uncharacterized protein YqgV (UPF0045/DUF77 family)